MEFGTIFPNNHRHAHFASTGILDECTLQRGQCRLHTSDKPFDQHNRYICSKLCMPHKIRSQIPLAQKTVSKLGATIPEGND